MVKFSLMLKFHRSARAESNTESGIFTNILIPNEGISEIKVYKKM